MTLHDLAEVLRKAAYELDEAHRNWEANDRQNENLSNTVARLTTRIRIADENLAAANLRLQKAEAAKRRAAKRKRAR